MLPFRPWGATGFRYRLALQQTRVLQEFERRSIDLRILLHSADRLQPKIETRSHSYLGKQTALKKNALTFQGI